jgi:hypothetical protein
MSGSASIPGLYYETVRPAAVPSPLRTDVAGFFGRTARGPVGMPVRVAGWREFGAVFGGLVDSAMTPFAVKGYFDNDARTAHVVRLIGAGSQNATGMWPAGSFDPVKQALNPDWPGASGLQAIAFQIAATSPGDWANGTAIDIRYWAVGRSGKPEIEVEINPPNEAAEILTGIDPGLVDTEVSSQSNYIRLTPTSLPAGVSLQALASPPAVAGPRFFQWRRITLSGGTALAPTKEDYLAAVTALGDQDEVALVVSPDLYHPDLPDPDDRLDIIVTMLTQANQLDDRLVIIDVPPTDADPNSAVSWVASGLRAPLTEPVLRNGALYHPWLLVPDPLAIDPQALRCTPASGCVAGVISREDLRYGAYFTPANAPIQQALDLSTPLDSDGQAALYAGGINLLTCSQGRGLLVWGGRVLGKDSPGGFIAHRRLIHLLVRAIRRVAEPLVFDTNGPELWLSLVRGITTVLLSAWRAGALRGDQPGQAFRVTCDATTNPPDQVDEGMVVCVIQVAPAVPMEFITLRVAVSADGQLEVFES